MNGLSNTGGAISIFNASPIIRDCVFLQNVSTWMGGAIYCDMLAEPSFIRCSFVENTAESGAGIAM